MMKLREKALFLKGFMKIGVSLGGFFLFCLLLSYLLIPKADPSSFPVSPRVSYSDGEIFYAGLNSEDEWLLPEELGDMGSWLPRVAVGIEDKRFYRHPGVDPIALIRAFFQNITSGRTVSGASTITAQLSRLSEPRERTLASKFLEFIKAIKIEREYSKDEILELYLNRAPFGGNIRGVGAASRYYFTKRPGDLSLGEASLLVAVLRGPAVYRPDRHPDRAKLRRDFILGLLLKNKVISPAEYEAAILEPIPLKTYPFPRENPSLSRRLIKGEDPGFFSYGKGSGAGKGESKAKGDPRVIISAINPSLQSELEYRLRLALRDFPREITGAGALLDNSSGDVIAYVGNARKSYGTHPYLDCAIAKRSPGSALKPFVYLSAFSDKIISPATLLGDTPLALSGLAPRNFDLLYRGPVSAKAALSDSLNVPAVRVLRKAGQERVGNLLRELGFSSISPVRDYGDSLVLGGTEVTLMELLRAYAILARGGLDIRPVFTRKGGGESPMGEGLSSPFLDLKDNKAPKRFFSEAAAFLTNNSLIDDGRLPEGYGGLSLPFKTGTSHGHRDGWIIMYSPEFTLVLWLGDPTGKGRENLSGLSALGPAAAAIFSSLKSIKGWDPSPFMVPPEGVSSYMACPVSGEPVGPDCPPAIKAYRLDKGAVTRPCSLHSREGGRVVIRWPKELRSFMAILNQNNSLKKYLPELVSPREGAVYASSLGKDPSIPLKAEGAEGDLHWYLDGEYLDVPQGSQPFVTLPPGEHRVSLMDGRSMTASARFRVERRDEQKGRGAAEVLSFN
jgi:penicillin-binding protein 1C